MYYYQYFKTIEQKVTENWPGERRDKVETLDAHRHFVMQLALDVKVT